MTALHKKLPLLPTAFVLTYKDFHFQALITCQAYLPTSTYLFPLAYSTMVKLLISTMVVEFQSSSPTSQIRFLSSDY